MSYTLINPWTDTEIKVELQLTQYANNKRLALQLWSEDGPYATLSVNLPKAKCGEGEFFVDTNNCPWAESWLDDNGIAEETGEFEMSGFCVYPKWRLIEVEE